MTTGNGISFQKYLYIIGQNNKADRFELIY